MNRKIGIEFVQQERESPKAFMLQGKNALTLTFARMTVSGIPDLICDLWCYEDKFGIAEPYAQKDGNMIFKHQHLDNPGVEATTHLMPSADAVESVVTVTGPDEAALRSIDTINACWQFRPSESFGNQGHYVRDFVHRCFIYTDRGFTRLTETERFPDTRPWDLLPRSARPPRHEYNSPPWVQIYIPVWREHPGQPNEGFGISTNRPIYSLVGCVSRDGKHLAAWGCYQCLDLIQAWFDCLHMLPDLQFDYDATSNQIVSRGKFYFMENDPDKLIERYKGDFAPVER